jgi:hypothetical protein
MYQRSRKLIKQLDWDIGYDTPDQAEKVGLLISKKWIDAGANSSSANLTRLLARFTARGNSARYRMKS